MCQNRKPPSHQSSFNSQEKRRREEEKKEAVAAAAIIPTSAAAAFAPFVLRSSCSIKRKLPQLPMWPWLEGSRISTAVKPARSPAAPPPQLQYYRSSLATELPGCSCFSPLCRSVVRFGAAAASLAPPSRRLLFSSSLSTSFDLSAERDTVREGRCRPRSMLCY